MIQLIRDFKRARHVGETPAEVIGIVRTLRSLRWKIRKFKNRQNQECTEQMMGYEVTGYDYLALEYFFNEIFLLREYSFKATTDAPVIIDCGANIGCATLFFKRLYPKAKIFSFEPNPHAFALLEKNIKRNNLTDVSLFNYALSDREEEISFFIGQHHIGCMVGSIRADRGGATELRVKAIRLSDFINRLGLNIDLIKMDVEGAELKIVEDLCQTRTIGKAEQILLEYHHKINNEPGNLSGFLKKFEENNFDYNLKTSYARKGEYQDVFVHFYKQ